MIYNNEFLKMCDKQAGLNALTAGDNWIEENNDWVTAILLESSELIDSLDWKWWKKGDNNLENARMELTDILFFTMSFVLQHKKHDDLFVLNNYLDTYDIKRHSSEFKYDLSIKDTIYKVKKLMCDVLVIEEMEILANAGKIYTDFTLQHKYSNVFINIIEIGHLLSITFEDLIKLYYSKLVLNKFRQANGYKEGTYVKHIRGNEDNVWLITLSNEMKLTDDFEKDLFDKYDEFYKKETTDIQ